MFGYNSSQTVVDDVLHFSDFESFDKVRGLPYNRYAWLMTDNASTTMGHSYIAWDRLHMVYGEQGGGHVYCWQGVSNPLLWVDSKAMIKFAKDVDLFTSAELPNPAADPY
ncbi:hypothetical protein Tco_1223493 [Tanacetum coccineum]